MSKREIIQIEDLLEAERSLRRFKRTCWTAFQIVVVALALAFVATWRQS